MRLVLHRSLGKCPCLNFQNQGELRERCSGGSQGTQSGMCGLGRAKRSGFELYSPHCLSQAWLKQQPLGSRVVCSNLYMCGLLDFSACEECGCGCECATAHIEARQQLGGMLLFLPPCRFIKLVGPSILFLACYCLSPRRPVIIVLGCSKQYWEKGTFASVTQHPKRSLSSL